MTADPLDGLRSDAQDLISRGIRRVHVLAWRDLDDPDAGGSEVHADEFERRWADAGLEVVHRTSSAAGQPDRAERHGYDVVRRGSRYTVFPRAIVSETTGRMGRSDALVEVMNGVPFFSPVWYRRPRILFLHHVHGPMWDQILPGPLASFGRALESRVAPPVYRRGLTATPSEATRSELVELGFHPDRVTAIPNGTDPRFAPGGERTPQPSIVAVARLAPVKRFGLLLDAVAEARAA
ncbi:glycosyltransferase, partial [Ilumatobacter sp.]|uniref:glycosyltransferase n=1 Tax=Ilumatobacter sp. TaxID=1967498 RepID=UPI003C69F881